MEINFIVMIYPTINMTAYAYLSGKKSYVLTKCNFIFGILNNFASFLNLDIDKYEKSVFFQGLSIE